MDPKNLVINPDDPYSMYESPGGVLDEINSGEFYRKAYTEMITHPENEILIPLVIYWPVTKQVLMVSVRGSV
jgi:hypothetical protein